MRSCAVVVLLASSAVSADEFTPDLGVHAPLRWEHPGEPVLHLDPIPPLTTEGLGAKTDGVTQIIDLGRRARLVGEGTWWKTSMAPLPPGSDVDDLSRGWRAGYTLTYDLGPLTIGASVGAGHVDSRYGRGTYRTIGVSVYRRFRLSRWMRAWIALSGAQQAWLGVDPPPGEANGPAGMLTIGTTFR